MSKENSIVLYWLKPHLSQGFHFPLDRQGVGRGMVKLALSAVGTNCARVYQHHTYQYHTDR